ncbi:hypothetical protein IMZ48_12145 [Candidatus Bathyarchaeota archaeon]|nr:hypothetical protein [Candidatus Bathyarchaeota archaeon]
MLPPTLLGLLATVLPLAAAGPLLEMRQEGACTVLVGTCNGQSIELDLTECACACLQNSCALVGSPGDGWTCWDVVLRWCRLTDVTTRRGRRSRGRIWGVRSRTA